MGFLSSIITDVNKNENLTKYNNELPGILEKIKQAKYNRKNFDTSIVAVSQGIREWLANIKMKNENILMPLNELQLRINGHMATFMEDISITDQLANWRGLSSVYLEEAERAESALDGIDDNLKNKLCGEIRLIKNVVDNFWNSVNDESVISSVNDLNTKVIEIPQKLNEAVGAKIGELKKALNDHFSNFNAQITNIKKEKNEHFQCIRDTFKAAKKTADDLVGEEGTFETNYRDNILMRFNEINDQLSIFTKDESDGNKAVLLAEFGKIKQGVAGLEDKVRHGLQELRDNIEILAIDVESNEENSLVKRALMDLRVAKLELVKVTGEDGNIHDGNIARLFEEKIQSELHRLVGNVKAMIRALGNQFGKIPNGDSIDGIMKHIEGEVQFIQDTIGDRNHISAVANPSDNSIYHNWDAIKRKVSEVVMNLTGGTGESSLTGIVNGVTKYAGKFSGTQFESKVLNGWVDEVFAKEPVKGWLNKYVDQNKSYDYFNGPLRHRSDSQLRAKVNQIVKDKIKDSLRKIIYTVQPGSKATVQENLSEIHTHLSEFSKYAMDKGQEIIREFEDFVKLQTELVSSSDHTGHKKYYLELAIPATLSAISSAAKQVADQLNTFKTTSKIHPNLESAAEKLRDLGSQMGSAKPGDKIDKALEQLKPKLENLDTHLTEAAEAGATGIIPSKSVDEAIASVTREVDGLFGKFNGSVRYKLDDAVEHFNSAAQDSIKDAADEAIKEAIDRFQLDGSKRIDVRNLMAQFHIARELLDEASEKLQEELNALKNIIQFVEGKRTQATYHMEQLKIEMKEILNKIVAIETPIQAAESAFDTAIEALFGVLNSAKRFANFALSALQKDLNKQVNKAFNELEEYIQKMLNAQKRTDFLTLQNSVSERIPQIQTIIRTDFNTGLKGLMNKLSSTFKTKGLQRPNEELQTYGNRVKVFCDTFFNDLKSQSDLSPDRLTPLADALSSLLSTMNTQRHFDHTVSLRLADLHAALTALSPSGFADASPLLNVMKRGVRAFHGELAKQYVSRYSGREVGEMVRDDKITAYGTKLSKVFLTSLTTLCDDLSSLKKYSVTTWRREQINKDTPIGYFLASRGYEVNSERGKQTGELRDKPGMLGFHIFKSLDKPIGSDNEHLKKCKEEANERDEKVTTAATKSPFGVVGILNCLFRHLHQYYTACHLRHIERPKSPSSVHQMLVWLTGLPHNRVFSKVSVSDIADLFDKPDKETHDETGDISFVSDDADTLPAHPQAIAASTLTSTIQKVCVDAEDVLTCILGYGHADGIYAVDFNTNSDGLSYPTAPGACFDMLCDVLNRLYQQLYFVYGQCSNEEPSVSWRDCWYGNLVGGSDWKCNAMQCPNQKGNQIHKQKCNQKCDQTAQCGIKSPLQSFLEDGLPGFLPHSFTKPGCKLTCTLSNHRGIPCRTPMGFGDISVAASHRQTGEYLRKVLHDFCGSESAPLTKLCAQLKCLLQKPPQTLGDIFAFYYGYLGGWAADFYGNFGKSNQHTQAAFRQAVNDAYFGEQYGHLDPITLVSSSKHGDEHFKGNLCIIADCTSGSVAPCGLYVKSMTQGISKYYSAEHKANHLSWIVYITETFCDLIKKLYDDCYKKCGPAGSKCHVKSCTEQCEIKYSDDKKNSVEDKSHKHDCKSIINCRDTHPTLYKYGFTFGNTWALNGSRNETRAKRTCKDFCEALKKMLGDGSVLITLRGQIDDFLWTIRTPFSYLVLALWLLSLFYLICVMVGRLDVLHIRSHLRIPSSHKITAQSLLAAAQVGRLAKISYLQP